MENLRVSIDGPMARLTLHRPPLNVLTTEMMGQMTEFVNRAAEDDRVRVLRLDAEGKVFCAGVDVGEHAGDAVGPMMEAFGALFDALERIPVPTVSVVHGAALGGGCEVALGTDLCLASDTASFGQPEIRLGVFAPPASVLMPRLIGERLALGLLLTGEAVPAADAARMGLVNRVFAADRFDDEVQDWMDRLLQLSGAALRQAKRAVVATRNRPVGEAHREVTRIYLDELMKTEDAHEGIQSFLDKRKPVWKHR